MTRHFTLRAPGTDGAELRLSRKRSRRHGKVQHLCRHSWHRPAKDGGPRERHHSPRDVAALELPGSAEVDREHRGIIRALTPLIVSAHSCRRSVPDPGEAARGISARYRTLEEVVAKPGRPVLKLEMSPARACGLMASHRLPEAVRAARPEAPPPGRLVSRVRTQPAFQHRDVSRGEACARGDGHLRNPAFDEQRGGFARQSW